MSTLALIAVFQCDNCPKVAVCRDENSWAEFELLWFDGLKHYCPECRSVPEVVASILKEKRLLRAIIEESLVKKYEGAWPEYVH